MEGRRNDDIHLSVARNEQCPDIYTARLQDNLENNNNNA